MDSLWSRFIFYCWLYILYITVYVTLLQTVLKLSTVTTPRPVPEVGGERRCNVSAVALAVRILQQLTDLSSTSRGKKSQTDTLFIHKWHCQQPIGVAAGFFTRFPPRTSLWCFLCRCYKTGENNWTLTTAESEREGETLIPAAGDMSTADS